MLQLKHEFRLLSAKPGVEGRVSRDEKVAYQFELTFSSEQAILDTAMSYLKTNRIHRWIKDNGWRPEGGPFRINERGDRTLTPREQALAMNRKQRKELMEQLMALELEEEEDE